MVSQTRPFSLGRHMGLGCLVSHVTLTIDIESWYVNSGFLESVQPTYWFSAWLSAPLLNTIVVHLLVKYECYT